MENKKNTLLISHAGEGLTKNAQKNIVNKFDLLYPDVLHTWLDLWMVFPRDYIPAEDRIKAAGEDVKNYSVFQDWMNDMDLKNRITDK